MPRVVPDGPFVEVPYALLTAWTSGGFTWAELEAYGGLPPAVIARLTPNNQTWCAHTVRVWQSIDVYAATGLPPECPGGRAWLGPGTDRPIRLITGVMSRPMRVGAFGRWKW